MPYTGGFPTSEVKVAHGKYDFSVDGGAVGAINITAAGAIPAGAVILGGYVEIDTAFTTGASATMALSVEGAGDLVAATVVSGAPYSTTGRKSIIPVFTGATTVKTTAARAIVATIAVGAVSAGVADVVLLYVYQPD